MDRAVTLPMAEVLAQAPEVSPWWGQEPEEWEDLAGVPTRALDELADVERVMLMVRLTGVSATELRILAAVARRGWCGRWTGQGLRAATGLRDSSVSRALGRLADRGMIRVDSAFFAQGSRDMLITVSGRTICHAYTRTTGAALGELTSAALPHDQETGAALGELTSAALPHDQETGAALGELASAADLTDSDGGSRTEGQIRPVDSLTQLRGKPDGRPNTPGGQPHHPGSAALVDLPSAEKPRRARAHTVGQLVSNNLDLEQQTNRHTGGVGGSAALVSSPSAADPRETPPDWWRAFIRKNASLRSPRPRPPSWREVLAFVDPEDADLTVIREACAQYLEQYSQSHSRPVRRPRGVIRAIYLGLLAQDLPLAVVPWATDIWLPGAPGGASEDAEDEAETDAERATLRQRMEDEVPPTLEQEPAARDLVEGVKGALGDQVPRPTFETWVRHLEGVSLSATTLVIAVPTSMTVEWMERRQYHAVQTEASKLSGRDLDVEFVVAAVIRAEGPGGDDPPPGGRSRRGTG